MIGIELRLAELLPSQKEIANLDKKSLRVILAQGSWAQVSWQINTAMKYFFSTYVVLILLNLQCGEAQSKCACTYMFDDRFTSIMSSESAMHMSIA